jgi:nuclear migration protein JNM1
LRSLQNELSALEYELADPSNPLIQRERDEENVDPGELIRGLVDVRTRLDKIRKVKEGRARLVDAVLEGDSLPKDQGNKKLEEDKDKATDIDDKLNLNSEMQTIVSIDRRVRELETIIGSSNMSLDEVQVQFIA